jgi:formylglycine-generating enzyme required for sulfatase activity/predicted MPP superfamily phosphohydrolase
MNAPIFMPNLLHLSDLHFGYDQDATARAQRTDSLDLLVKEIGKLQAAWKPGILVISGDLTWQGRTSGYGELAEWLTKKLFPATGLTAADCVICPGNHDIDRNAAFSLTDRTQDAKRADELLRPERLAKGFAAPFEAFAKFAADLGIPAPALHGQPNYLAGVRELHGLRFLCANSAWFCRDSDTDRGQLWLGLPQLQSMQRMRPDEYDTAQVTVAVLHHPQEWLANAECVFYDNRPGAYGYLAARAHVILSGHTHGAIEQATRCFDRARLFVGGAAYDNYQYRNNFSILKIDPKARTVIRRPWELDPRVPKWEEKERQEYSLRIEKLGRNRANPARYIAWLQDKTRSIELNQLHVAPQEVPPPAIDTLFIKLTTAAPAKEGIAQGRPEPIPLEEALRGSRRLVIEGKPGCGKTTFVRWIAWMLCRPAGAPDYLRWLAGFPIWVRISELDQHIASTLERPQPGDPPTAVDPRWIAHFLASHQGWDLDEAFFADTLGAGDTVLLLDGLDEAGNQQRRVDMVKLIREAAEQYGCRIVVTTRPGVHEGRATLEGFGLASIDDLDDRGIDGFLLQWCRWLKRGEESAAQTYFAEVRQAVAVPGIRHLARNPLMLTSLAVLHFRRNRLPEQRVKLYEQILDWLAEQAVDKHREYKKDALLERFGILALGMQEWKGGQKLGIGIDDAAALLAPGVALAPMRRFLEQAQIDSGIVTLRGGEIAFWHRSFQEYPAARTMADLPDAQIPRRAREMLYSAEGREVLPLVAGCMAENAKQRLSLLFEDLTQDAASQERLERKAHAAGVLGNMLADIAPFEYQLSGTAAKQYGELRDAVMAIFQKGMARQIGLKTRVAAAEALDQASQARLHTPGEGAYWKEIKGGAYTLGGDSGAYQSLPKKSMKIGGFGIGRFPVTVWEFGKYLEETGVEAPRIWEEQSRHPGRPVVCVTGRQARDYCTWARCKLPTNEQWEVAARGAEGRIFPWGPEEPDEYRANFNSMAGGLTPVGMFPDGDTPEGVADMAGNVWEWTRSDFNKEAKSVRGASFFDVAINLRAAVRVRDEPVGWDGLVGFPCVRE